MLWKGVDISSRRKANTQETFLRTYALWKDSTTIQKTDRRYKMHIGKNCLEVKVSGLKPKALSMTTRDEKYEQ